MAVGLAILLVGGGLYLAGRLSLPLGRLPGDIRIERGNLTCLIPLATSLLLSVVLTVVLNLLVRMFKH
jgi:hypothetical protein